MNSTDALRAAKDNDKQRRRAAKEQLKLQVQQRQELIDKLWDRWNRAAIIFLAKAKKNSYVDVTAVKIKTGKHFWQIKQSAAWKVFTLISESDSSPTTYTHYMLLADLGMAKHSNYEAVDFVVIVSKEFDWEPSYNTYMDKTNVFEQIVSELEKMS
jgi:hypothetical protein